MALTISSTVFVGNCRAIICRRRQAPIFGRKWRDRECEQSLGGEARYTCKHGVFERKDERCL